MNTLLGCIFARLRICRRAAECRESQQSLPWPEGTQWLSRHSESTSFQFFAVRQKKGLYVVINFGIGLNGSQSKLNLLRLCSVQLTALRRWNFAGDCSWRVRASVCLALEDLAFLFSESADSQTSEGSHPHGKVAAAASCMPSLLFKFLTDRSVRWGEYTAVLIFSFPLALGMEQMVGRYDLACH